MMVSMKYLKMQLSLIIYLGLTRSSKAFMVFKDTRTSSLGQKNEGGAQVFLVASEDIATGCLIGSSIKCCNPIYKRTFLNTYLCLIVPDKLVQNEGLSLTFTIPHPKGATSVF